MTISLGSLVQCLKTLEVKNLFHNIQPEPPPTRLQAIPLGSVTSYHGEEIGACPP